jgi:hypothetical protein
MNLPTELYVKIFEQSKLNDRIEMSYVSKLFNQLNNRVEYTRRVILSDIEFIPEYITNIKIIFDDFEDWWFCEYLNKFQQIKFLNLSKTEATYDNFIDLNLRQLESLSLNVSDFSQELIDPEETSYYDIRYMFNYSRPYYIPFDLRIDSFPQLRKLQIDYDAPMKLERSLTGRIEYFPDLLRQLSSLKSLKLKLHKNLDNDNLEKLSNIDNIKELKLINCSIQKNGFKHFKNFKNLKKLTLYHLLHFRDIKTLGSLKIKELKIICADDISIKNLGNLERMKNLRSIYLHSNLEQSKINKLICLSKFPKLRRLTLTVKEFDMIELLKKLTNIERINLITFGSMSSQERLNLEQIKNLKILH